MKEKHSPASKTIWAYGYEIVPPQSQDRLSMIEAVLNDEHSNAKLGARTWEGRFVLEEQVTHILVVSDSPDQNLEVNRRLEAELKMLEVGFSITVPLTVADQETIAPVREPPFGT